MDTVVRNAQKDLYLKPDAAGYCRRVSRLHAAASGGVDIYVGNLKHRQQVRLFCEQSGTERCRQQKLGQSFRLS